MYRNHGFYSGTRHFTSDHVMKERNRAGEVTRVQSHTSVEVSSVSVTPLRRRSSPPRYARRNEAPSPAFTSLRQLVKPQSAGVTIVNVYNREKDRPVVKRQPRQKVTVEKVRRKMRRECRPFQEGHLCLTTDEDRDRVLRLEKLLPRWQEREEAAALHQIVLDDYDTEMARHSWDAFFATQNKKNKKDGQADCCFCKDEVKRTCRRDEVAVTGQRCSPRHAMGAFYGSCETEKICQNAIQQVLKCEREIQQLQFTSSNVLPQTGECLKKLRWVHGCLKLFHTHFRELQMETDEKLQTRVGNNFTIKVTAPGKHELPFPKHLH